MTTMLDLMSTIFGVYTPIVDDSGVALSGMAGVNWEYVGGVVLFAVVLVSFFRIVGGVLKKI